jgi:hypothetical protein
LKCGYALVGFAAGVGFVPQRLNERACACAFDEDAERVSGWRLARSGTEYFSFTVRMGCDRTRVNYDACAETRRVDVGAAAKGQTNTPLIGLKIRPTRFVRIQQHVGEGGEVFLRIAEGFAACHFRNPGSLVIASFIGVYDLD